MDAHTLWNFGITYLADLRKDYGFAASESGTGIYNTLFGRDSLWILIFLLEAVKWQPRDGFCRWVEKAGADIFLALSKYQGSCDNPVNEEQPGKIIHEYRDEAEQHGSRLSEMKLGFVNGRLYSGFDQTFLFISAFRQYMLTFGASDLHEEIWPHVQSALGWIENFADADGDGLFEYQRRNRRNVLNQVWRDSFDSVTATGVDIPLHPIAWVEVQAYAYKALLDAAACFDDTRWNNAAEAARLRERARVLRGRVNRQFWCEHLRCFAIALSAERTDDGAKEQIPIVSSNAGHMLWAECVDPEHIPTLIARLMEPDMTTRFGLRTLSSLSHAYAPFAYHRGCIWPFDNAIVAIGLLKHAYKAQALRIIGGVAEALMIIRSPIELYLALDKEVFLQPELAASEALALRRPNQENLNQGWTAAALVLFACVLATEEGTALPDL